MNKDLSKASIKSLHHQIVFFFLLTSYSSKCKLNCMISVWSTANIIRVNTEGSQKFFCAQNLRIQSDILPELFCDFRSKFNAKIFSYPSQQMESALLNFSFLSLVSILVVKKKQCLDFASHTKFLTVLLVLIANSFSLAKDQNLFDEIGRRICCLCK